MFFFSCSDNMEAPSNKKPRTSPVMVEQTGDTDKVLIDQVRDTESMFEEVMKMGKKMEEVIVYAREMTWREEERDGLGCGCEAERGGVLKGSIERVNIYFIVL